MTDSTVTYADTVSFEEIIDKGNCVLGDSQIGYVVYDDNGKSHGMPFRGLTKNELEMFGSGAFCWEWRGDFLYFKIDSQNLLLALFDYHPIEQLPPKTILNLVIQDKAGFEQSYFDTIANEDECVQFGVMT